MTQSNHRLLRKQLVFLLAPLLLLFGTPGEGADTGFREGEWRCSNKGHPEIILGLRGDAHRSSTSTAATALPYDMEVTPPLFWAAYPAVAFNHALPACTIERRKARGTWSIRGPPQSLLS